MDEKPYRIMVVARNFSAAAMEYHRSKMAERGYRLENRIEPAVFQMIEDIERPQDLFNGEPMFVVSFVRTDRE